MKRILSFVLGCIISNCMLAQNVGIGTPSPSDRLHVLGGRIRLEETSYPWISFVNGSILRGFIGAEGVNMRVGTWPGNTTGSVLFRTNLTDHVALTPTGDFGIGTVNPQEKLHVKGITRLDPAGAFGGAILEMYAASAVDQSLISFYNQFSATSASAAIGYNSPNNYLNLQCGTGNLFLKDAGLGISTVSPVTKLHISTGQDAGLPNTDNGYLMLGPATGSNLILDNNEILARNNTTPAGTGADLFIQRDAGNLILCANEQGGVGIGVGSGASIPAGFLLAVDGKIISEELKVQLSGNWPDYVFDNKYRLRSFDELRKYIAENKHLPNIPPAAEVEKNGIEVGDMQKRMMEKIEELTLYVLKLEAEVKEMKKQK